MKKTPFLSLAAVCLLAQCNKAPVQNAVATVQAATGPSVPVITTGASPHFLKVASHLDVGGMSLNYADQDGLLESLANIGDEILKGLPEADRSKVPADFSFKKVLSALGLDGLKAAGTSTRKTADGLYYTRSFAYIPGGRKGLMSLTGGKAEPLLTLNAAPKGTDIALEFPLHLKTLTQESLPVVMALMQEKERQELEAQLSMPLPPLGLTGRQIGEKMDARLALFVQAHTDQQLALPTVEVPLPGVDALLVADRLGWLLEPVKQQFLPMLNNPGAPFEVADKDGVLTLTFREPVGPAPMDFQPVLRFDSKADRLYVATRPAFLKAAVEGKEKLASEAGFKKAWTGLPEEGNAAFYLSGRLLGEVAKRAKETLAASNEPEETKKNVTKVLDFLAPYLSKDQAACMANLAEGSTGAANLVLPLNDTSTLSTLTTISILSSLAVPTFATVNQKSQDMKAGNEGRQIALALNLYAQDNNGQYPPTLEQLGQYLGEGDDNILKNSTTVWLYNPTLGPDAPETAIILAASEPTTFGKPKRQVIRKSGIVETITEEQFQLEKDDNLR